MADRIVIITGGSKGLGAGLVRSYLESGDRVATCARSTTPEVEAWSSDPASADRFLFVEADLAVRDEAAAFVQAVVTKWGGVDILVNNAGVARDGILAVFADEDVDTVVDLNMKATFQVTKLVSRRMLSKGAGKIINISSIVGLSGYRGLSVYAATKGALDAFTRSLARELGSRGITVNSVAPGYLRTEMSHGLDEGQMQQIIRRTPAGRLGEPGDVARAVQFLTSDDNDFITGQVLVVDGGLTS
ncbi:SDR family NAD(P)-dependent oxidoreductase [Aeromicrobium sp. 9AM]|uniref:SDR family NAD(P)-dependent oxidoreductase n=1 Tax=Aeromicrobium sp. 9AM TaxID=2653126 RepID=UPI0012F1DC9F|nr:3-oxoacyl-ACP reductase family protein [Aeromicrobium sp. 9AM]VXB47788.1 3-oxoacyl-ACP reductase [Aeromicrobium sp. 9AM]